MLFQVILSCTKGVIAKEQYLEQMLREDNLNLDIVNLCTNTPKENSI